MSRRELDPVELAARERDRMDFRIEKLEAALRRIRDMEAFEFDQREVAREALDEGE